MYKSPLAAAAELGPEGFVGDQQADRRVHGGPEKAVHLYPARHYAELAARFPEAAGDLHPGSLGENISTDDIDERDVRIGDIWKLGSALLQVCQPRNPCWKIDERFACEGVALFIERHLLTGWYWRVLQPGTVAPGDTLDRVQAALAAPSLHEAMALWRELRPAPDELGRLAATPGIAASWRHKIEQRLAWLQRQAAG